VPTNSIDIYFRELSQIRTPDKNVVSCPRSAFLPTGARACL
jgi:hypothetical protein